MRREISFSIGPAIKEPKSLLVNKADGGTHMPRLKDQIRDLHTVFYGK